MSAVTPLPVSPALRVDYVDGAPDALLRDERTLAVLGFGTQAPHVDDPRYLRVMLQPWGAAPLECWRTDAPVRRGRDDGIAWAASDALLFGAIELDEGDGDVGITAEQAYRRMCAFVRAHGYPHLLRVWNYLDAITVGEGDAERYRVFCVGRARGLGAHDPGTLPAATAIGRVDGVRRLQVYWLAARVPGTPVENPRQMSAYRYPRQYGPQPPSFARAMLPPSTAMPLLVSGTASIVGHQSLHADSVRDQIAETLRNFDSLLAAARHARPTLPAAFDAGSRLKVYVREADELPLVAAELDARLPGVPRVLLHAGVCRRELRIEIDGVHGP
ncbi:MAG TPA: pteridine-dependent deoxygenase [Lysobacter sp.]|nr:pteridine-dependent deoxygenase [Lysobacter sp.]